MRGGRWRDARADRVADAVHGPVVPLRIQFAAAAAIPADVRRSSATLGGGHVGVELSGIAGAWEDERRPSLLTLRRRCCWPSPLPWKLLPPRQPLLFVDGAEQFHAPRGVFEKVMFWMALMAVVGRCLAEIMGDCHGGGVCD